MARPGLEPGTPRFSGRCSEHSNSDETGWKQAGSGTCAGARDASQTAQGCMPDQDTTGVSCPNQSAPRLEQRHRRLLPIAFRGKRAWPQLVARTLAAPLASVHGTAAATLASRPEAEAAMREGRAAHAGERPPGRTPGPVPVVSRLRSWTLRRTGLRRCPALGRAPPRAADGVAAYGTQFRCSSTRSRSRRSFGSASKRSVNK